jgi:hypothetical protein
MVAGLFIAGCEEDPSDLGLGVQPGDDLDILTTDTVSVYAYSYLMDSLRTDETEFSFIGSHYDPTFGVTTATTYTSFSLSASSHEFGDNAVLDSLVLMMQYENYSGDTTTPQTFYAYKLQGEIVADSLYYSNQTFEYDENTDYAEGVEFYPHPTDSVTIDTNKYRAHARIRLSDELGEYLMDADESVMESTESLVEYFPGLVLAVDKETQPGAGSIIAYNLRAEQSALRLYYHNDEDTTSFDYVVGSATPRTVHYNHYGYAEASEAFRQQVVEGDTSMGAQNLYLQSMSGVRTKVVVPDLPKTAQPIVINEAQLITNHQYNAGYDVPESLFMVGLDSTNVLYDLPDRVQGNAYFGGSLNENESLYSFRLSIFTQGLITGRAKGNTLILGIPSEASSMGRLVLNGHEADSEPLKLKIVYTLAE